MSETPVTGSAGELVATSVYADHVVLRPPNRLKARAARVVAPREKPGPDPIMRAEHALGLLSSEFDAWMTTEIERLEQARAATAAGGDPKSLAGLYRAAHDLRGQGATLGFPLAGEIADGLCALIERMGDRKPPQAVLDRHVEAIRAIVREGVRNREHPMGSAIAAGLAGLRDQLAPPIDGG